MAKDVEPKDLDNMRDAFKNVEEDGLHTCAIMSTVPQDLLDLVSFTLASPGRLQDTACSQHDCRDCLMGMTFIKLLYEDSLIDGE
jgi:hypothetical protein